MLRFPWQWLFWPWSSWMWDLLRGKQERRELEEKWLLQYGHVKCNGYNKDTEKGTTIKVYRTEINGTTQNKMDQAGNRRLQKENKGLATNRKGKTVGRKNRLETSCPLAHIRQTWCEKEANSTTMGYGDHNQALLFETKILNEWLKYLPFSSLVCHPSQVV